MADDRDRDRGAGRSSTQGGPISPGWASEQPGDSAVTASDPTALLLQSLRSLVGQKPVWAPTKVASLTITWDQLQVGAVQLEVPFQIKHLRILNYITGYVHEVYTDTWSLGPSSVPQDVPNVDGGMKLLFRWEAPGSVANGAGGAGQIIRVFAYSRWLYGDM